MVQTGPVYVQRPVLVHSKEVEEDNVIDRATGSNDQ